MAEKISIQGQNVKSKYFNNGQKFLNEALGKANSRELKPIKPPINTSKRIKDENMIHRIHQKKIMPPIQSDIS